jgi:hypothetical protein
VYDQVSVHDGTGSPRLVITTLALNPPGHCEVTEYATEQPVAAWAATAVRAETPIVAAAATATAIPLRLADMGLRPSWTSIVSWT